VVVALAIAALLVSVGVAYWVAARALLRVPPRSVAAVAPDDAPGGWVAAGTDTAIERLQGELVVLQGMLTALSADLVSLRAETTEIQEALTGSKRLWTLSTAGARHPSLDPGVIFGDVTLGKVISFAKENVLDVRSRKGIVYEHSLVDAGNAEDVNLSDEALWRELDPDVQRLREQ
jgi:hypothetical protein